MLGIYLVQNGCYSEKGMQSVFNLKWSSSKFSHYFLLLFILFILFFSSFECVWDDKLVKTELGWNLLFVDHNSHKSNKLKWCVSNIINYYFSPILKVLQLFKTFKCTVMYWYDDDDNQMIICVVSVLVQRGLQKSIN